MKWSVYTALAAACLVISSGPRQLMAEEPSREVSSQQAVFLPFDFYSRHEKELALNQEQQAEMQRLSGNVLTTIHALETQRSERTKALQETLARTPVDMNLAMEQFQAVLNTENEMKAVQFRSGIEMRNKLRPDQIKNAQFLAAQENAGRGNNIRTELTQRLQQLRAEVHKRTGGEPSAGTLDQLTQIEKAVKEGRFGQAKNLLEQTLRALREEPEEVTRPR